MLIDTLVKVLAPPSTPDVVPSLATWNPVFRFLGTRLPEDYVQFINRYGGGVINSHLFIYSPFTPHDSHNLLSQFGPALSAIRSLKSSLPDRYPYPLYFEPGGILPFAHNEWGDSYFWLTTTETIDDWPLLLIEGRNGDYRQQFNMNLTQFLLNTFAGMIYCPILPDAWHESRPFFESK